MHVSYEYILAGLIIILILTTSELTIFSLMTEKLTDIRQEGSYSTAEKIVDVLLLSPGYPFDWDSNASVDPDSLGLAFHNSLEAYILDPDKVNRLNENSSGYITPTKARELLGLRKDYHFSLQITPMLDVQIEYEGDGEYSFAIFNDKGYSAANVNVTAFYIPNSFVSGIDYTSKSNITMIDGTCILDFDYQQYPQDFFKIIWASPPCVNYSVLQNSWLGRQKRINGELVTFTREMRDQKMLESDQLVLKTFEIINYFNPEKWFIEKHLHIQNSNLTNPDDWSRP